MPLVITFLLRPLEHVFSESRSPRRPKLCWKAANAQDLSSYNQFISAHLEPFLATIIHELRCACAPNCEQNSHKENLSSLYRTFTEAIISGATLCIPQNNSQPRNYFAIPGWNKTVKLRHRLARKAFLHWRSCGSPKEGFAVGQMRDSRLAFKYAKRKCRREEDQRRASRFAEALAGQKPDRFWSMIKRQLGGGVLLPPSFGSVTGEGNIANMWREHFLPIFNDVSCSSDNEVLNQLSTDVSPMTPTPPISAEDVRNAIAKLKAGKSPGWDRITTDHLLHLHAEAASIIAVLFNSMLNHSILPESLIYTLLVPLVKDKSGILDDRSNYRVIALSTALSKVLELILVERLSPFLSTGDAQFGFKSSHSTTQATYVLKETINYFTERGSPVYTCFLDASKAFDRVCHAKLFQILAHRGVPSSYLKLLLSWYTYQRVSVKWSQSESKSFPVQNGVRQGGNLSPLLFNVYIDELLCELRTLRIGCYVGNCAVNVLAYADDIAQ